MHTGVPALMYMCCVTRHLYNNLQLPDTKSIVPKMKKGVLGVGPTEIVYGCYDGDTVEVCVCCVKVCVDAIVRSANITDIATI